jgi:hypothetical protein
MTSRGVSFHPSPGGQFSAVVDTLQGDGVSSLPSVTEAGVPTEAETQLTRKLERRPWPTQTSVDSRPTGAAGRLQLDVARDEVALQRITSPLTVARDLQERRVAQR